MTQWFSPAIRLHSHYGFFEVLTAYTPAHSYPRTITYRLNVNPLSGSGFYPRRKEDFHAQFERAGFVVDPKTNSVL